MVKTGFIDWTEEKLYLYIFEKKANQYSLIDSRSAPVKGALNQSALQCIVEAGIDEFYVSVPADLLSIRALKFPFSDRHKIKATIAYELEGLLLGSTDNYAIDYLTTDASGAGGEVLAACLEKTRLKEIIGLFSSAGLEPKGITSLDLKLNNKNISMFFDGHIPKEQARAEAAKDELLNPTINFRQDELSFTGDIDRIKRSLRLSGILVLLLIFLLGSYAIIKLMTLKKENIMLTNEISTLYRAAFPEDTKIIDPVRQFKGNMTSLKEKRAVLAGTPVLDIILDISRLKNRSVTLNELSTDEKNIIIKGTALSFENVDEFKNKLMSSFTDVKVLDSKVSADKKIIFSIIARGKNT